MTILHDIYVKCRNGNGALVDDTSEVQLRGWPLPEKYSEFLLETPTEKGHTKPQIRNGINSRATGASGNAFSSRKSSQHDRPCTSTTPSQKMPVKRIYEPRRHCRTVFKEVGRRLDQLDKQRDLIQSLIDALTGIFFYDAEYLHRDISVGNLLWCYDFDHHKMICKITDLEYARPHLLSNEEDYCPHDHKTVIPFVANSFAVCSNAPQGTPAFMAVEVQSNEYLFESRESSVPLAASRSFDPTMWPQDLNSAQTVPFLHNYLHDIEGLWWIMIYHLYTTRPTHSNQEPSDSDKRIDAARGLFSLSVGGSPRRKHFVTKRDSYLLMSKTLPSEYGPLAWSMNNARRVLTDRYSSVENPSLERVLLHGNFQGIHDELIPHFRTMLDYVVESFENLGPAGTILRPFKLKTRPTKGKRASHSLDDDSHEPPSSKKPRTDPPVCPPPRRSPYPRRATTNKVSGTPMEDEELSMD
ncbi:hypothetical protein PM082_015862 [Marasmius tenuissimus]|nr:hypothetical protein PM082_015862 [Marasmius tenuissimus]